MIESSEHITLQGGHVIDPKNGTDGIRDVTVANGQIENVAASGKPDGASKVIDVSGCYVTAGAVDIHTHLFHTAGNPHAWAGELSVPPDVFSFKSGTTTMVDTGSAGRRNFPLFRASVIDRSRTRVFGLINIASYGMINDMIEQYPEDFDPDETAAVAREHADAVVGFKTAHYFHPDWTSVDRVLEAGEKADLPVMIDFGYFRKERPYWQLVTDRMRPGDISTHCFRGPVPVADENGRVYSYLRQARERGVKFDLGHGAGSFLFRNAVPAVRDGFYPDSISTDFHGLSMNAALVDLPTTMSKLIAVGMPMAAVFEAVTWNPARMIGHPELGHLSAGATADVAVWKLEEGDFGYKDTVGGAIRATQRLRCVMTLKDGEIVWDADARDAVDYRSIPADAGIRDGEYLIPPAE
jgi:dihydroorotase